MLVNLVKTSKCKKLYGFHKPEKNCQLSVQVPSLYLYYFRNESTVNKFFHFQKFKIMQLVIEKKFSALKGTEWSLTPTPDIITFMHLSIKECNGGLTIVVTERQHGEKIILTSELFAGCFKLEIGSPFLTSCSLWVHNTTSPLHFQHLNAFLLLYWCRVVTIHSCLQE